MEKSDRIILSKYEISVAGMLAITLTPTFGVLMFQLIWGLIAGQTNNFKVYFVTGAVFAVFLLFSGLICVRYAKEMSVSKNFLYGGGILLFAMHLLLLIKSYLNSSTVYPALSGEWFPWHSKSDWKVFCLMLGVSAAGILVFCGRENRGKWLKYFVIPPICLLQLLQDFLCMPQTGWLMTECTGVLIMYRFIMH